ncbi:MAG: hypothetical protein GY928_25115 [Colwellia sp.]|nr:hypothetical protein [Colwellia sp.]
MNKITKMCIALVTILISDQAMSEWSGYLNVNRVEVHTSGVFLVSSISGLTATGCIDGQVYNYAQFKTSNEKLADRALSSFYYAQSTNKKLKVSITSCEGSYAVSNGIWVE